MEKQARAWKVLAFLTLAIGYQSCTNPIDAQADGDEAVNGVTMNKSSHSLVEGASEQLVATVSPSSAQNQAIFWSSDSPNIGVSPSGLVTAVTPGSGSITVTTMDGSFSATCDVTVLSGAVTGISLNKNATSIGMGLAEQLIASIAPVYALNQGVTWTSDSANASVSSTGLVTAASLGTATITATTVDGSFTASCVVTVIPVPVSGVSLNKSSTTIVAGQSETLVATINPSNAANQNINWSSSDNNIALVVDGVVAGLAAGTATITVTTEDGSFTATCLVTVSGSLPHTYLEVLPAATALQNGINAAVASNNTSASAYNVLVMNPIVMTCYFNNYVDSGYTLNGSIAINFNADLSQGPMNGTVQLAGGTVTEISYHDAVFSAPKSGTLGIGFTDGSSWSFDIATSCFTQN